MKKKIIIIDNSNLAYSGEEINGVKLRGTETSLILLAEQFVKMNIDYLVVVVTAYLLLFPSKLKLLNYVRT